MRPVFVGSPVSTTDACRCCAGDAQIYGEPCLPCQAALLAGDRTGHPHALSTEQMQAADRGRSSGREIVDVLALHHPDGTRTVLMADEGSRREAP